MTSNGFTRGGRSGRTPHFLTVGLLVVICILAFNYWNISSKNKVLDVLNAKMKDNIEELVLRKVHLEKRTDALNKELQGNNQVVHDTQEKANTCQENLREVGDERDHLRTKVTQDEEEIKQLQRSVEDFNDTMSQMQLDLNDLRKENKGMQQQLSEMNGEMGRIRREKQSREEQLYLAQQEIEQHKLEVQALKQQMQLQQQQHIEQNSRNPDLRQGGAVNTPQREANQQLAFNPVQPQNTYQQQLQNNYQQQNNNYLPQAPRNQQLGAIPGNSPQILGIPGSNLQLGAVPGNLPGQPNQMHQELANRPLGVPGVPKFNIPDLKLLGEGGRQKDIKIAAEELADTNPEAAHNDVADEDVYKPSNSLPVEGRVDGNSPDNEGEDFIQGEIKKNEVADVRDMNAAVPQDGDREDSQAEDGRDGDSNMQSPSDAVDNPQDPANGIGDAPSAGRADDIEFIGRKDDFGNEESEESSSYDYEDDENNGDDNKKGENEGEEENQIVPGNMKDYDGANGGLGFDLQVEDNRDLNGRNGGFGLPANNQEDHSDDDKLRFKLPGQ